MEFSAIKDLGVAAFAILVMWWVYKDTSARIDKRDSEFRTLEKEVRDSIMKQLNENTIVFNRVIEHLKN